jgi:nicotinate-nucleotide pyrophosphorylase (carboxylating)
MLIEHNELIKFITNALNEDLGDGDHTSNACISENAKNKAELLIKDNGVIAGVKLAKLIFQHIDSSLEITQFIEDGEKVKKGDIAFIIQGNTLSILKAERLVLNCMQLMSAIATKTNLFKSIISSTKCKLLDTRKTVPLNRFIEKWAVKIGGGENHRFGLYDMIMIKDNHIDFAGNVLYAIRKTKDYLKRKGKKLDIIVEARNLEEVQEIIKAEGIKRILLDNFNYEDTKMAVQIIDNRCETESSGNINEETILHYAKCGVDFVSIGSLTHSIKNFDLSLNAI